MSGRRREFLSWLGASTLFAAMGRGTSAGLERGARRTRAGCCVRQLDSFDLSFPRDR
jgi:hypothetical protein